MWSIYDARCFVIAIEPIAKEWGLGVAIGGSVALNGVSTNDLDIILFNLKSTNMAYHGGFLESVQENLGLKLRGMVDHSGHGDDKLIYVFRTKEGHKIDLFFVNLKFVHGIAEAKVLIRKKLKRY